VCGWLQTLRSLAASLAPPPPSWLWRTRVRRTQQRGYITTSDRWPAGVLSRRRSGM